MATDAEYKNAIQALGWPELRTLWDGIQQGDTPGWEAGKAFEYLVLRAFQLDGLDIRWPFSVNIFETANVEQIDGVIHYVGLSCLVESKDYSDKVNIEPIAKLRNQLLRRPANTIGMIFSRSGFTKPAIMLCHFVFPQTILLWDGAEIEYALDNRKIAALLQLKYRASVEEGIPDYDVREEALP
ncbi:MAG: restriction endonuclease [Candidatus Methylumidiphilus sp.]